MHLNTRTISLTTQTAKWLQGVSIHSVGMWGRGMIQASRQTEREAQGFTHCSEWHMTEHLWLISRIFHLIFSDNSWPRVTQSKAKVQLGRDHCNSDIHDPPPQSIFEKSLFYTKSHINQFVSKKHLIFTELFLTQDLICRGQKAQQKDAEFGAGIWSEVLVLPLSWQSWQVHLWVLSFLTRETGYNIYPMRLLQGLNDSKSKRVRFFQNSLDMTS